MESVVKVNRTVESEVIVVVVVIEIIISVVAVVVIIGIDEIAIIIIKVIIEGSRASLRAVNLARNAPRI